jgi:hypothetical protein
VDKTLWRSSPLEKKPALFAFNVRFEQISSSERPRRIKRMKMRVRRQDTAEEAAIGVDATDLDDV